MQPISAIDDLTEYLLQHSAYHFVATLSLILDYALPIIMFTKNS